MYVCINTHRKKLSSRTRERERVFARRLEPFSFERLALGEQQHGEKSRQRELGTDGWHCTTSTTIGGEREYI